MDERWIGLACACALGLALGAWLALQLRVARERLRVRARSRRAREGEARAARLLTARGFRVQGRQVRRRYSLVVDGVAREVELILDYVVSRGDETLVAEVKTGAGQAGVQHPETRRQLLEYQLATGTRRVLLVDPEAETISEIVFPIPDAAHPTAAARTGWKWLVAALAAFVLGMLIWRFRSC
jgi:Holliday junction resolvase-like predicted endonuclease